MPSKVEYEKNCGCEELPPEFYAAAKTAGWALCETDAEAVAACWNGLLEAKKETNENISKGSPMFFSTMKATNPFEYMIKLRNGEIKKRYEKRRKTYLAGVLAGAAVASSPLIYNLFKK